MKISEIITDKYKLRIEPNVYYDLLADVREAEEAQEPCEDVTLKEIFCMGCEYKEHELCEDLISIQAVLDILKEKWNMFSDANDAMQESIDTIEALRPVSSSEKPNKWIPLKTRPMTDEESTFYRDWAEYGAELFDCHLPDDGQEVLVSWGGNVCIDTFVKDDRDGCYFEGVDIGDVEAWMPLPEPYKEEGGKE